MSLDHVILKLVREGDFEVTTCPPSVRMSTVFRSGELKSGELLTIGIGMILTVDRKHNFFMSFCVRMYDVFILRAIFLPEN